MQYNEYYAHMLSALLLLAVIGWALAAGQLVRKNARKLDPFMVVMFLVFSVLVLGQAVVLKNMNPPGDEPSAATHLRH
jgi:heme A synthase